MRKETDSRIGLLCFAGVVFFLLVVSAAAPADENTKIVMGFHYTSGAGQSSSQMFDMANKFAQAVKENYGLDFQIKSFYSGAEIEEAFLKNEIDAAALWPGDIVDIMARGASVHPWSTYQVKKTKRASFCLWRKKNEKPLTVSDVMGKRMINTEYSIDWLLYLRDFLYRNGIDKPLWSVFRSFTSVSGANSSFMSLVAGDADLYWSYKDNETIIKLVAPNMANQVEYALCSESVYARGAIILNRKTLSKDKLKKADEAYLKLINDFNELANKDNRVKPLKQYMNLARIRFAVARPDEFDYEIKLFQDARKRGWITEAEFIIEQMGKAARGKPVEIKMDYRFCKKTCADKKDLVACIGKCMK